MSDYRETLERLASRLESDGMGGDMADASAIREALAEVERLKAEVVQFTDELSEAIDERDEARALVRRLAERLAEEDLRADGPTRALLAEALVPHGREGEVRGASRTTPGASRGSALAGDAPTVTLRARNGVVNRNAREVAVDQMNHPYLRED